MKFSGKYYALLLALSLVGMRAEAETISFNEGWEFSKDSLVSSKPVDLPHDFMVERVDGPDDTTHIGPFSAESPNGRSLGHFLDGTGWYRKFFTVSAGEKGKRFSLLFDGSYMETDVIVNGELLCAHKNGYTPFYVDITGALKSPGIPNEIIVKVRNSGRNSRWFSGSGLYRDVDLVVTEPVHVARWGVYVTTEEVSDGKAKLGLELTTVNDSGKKAVVPVKITIFDPDGRNVASLGTTLNLQPGTGNKSKLFAEISAPSLWSVDSPALYSAKVELLDRKSVVIDSYVQKFGIRTISCDAKNGLRINGEPVLLKGGCVHHDNGLLGAAALRTAEYRRVRQLKDNGYNAVRCAHNPPSRHFLDACDELGIIVMDEFTDMWEQPKNTDDYSRFFVQNWESDLENMLLRDRNHPSIIFWSIGNEIPNWSIADASRIGRQLSDKCRQMDPTRLVTQGITGAYIHLDWDNSRYTFQHLDVAGYNYLRDKYDSDHEKFPDRVIVCTESYPKDAFKYWKDVVDKPYVIGDFVWTALEHLGESGCGSSRYVDASRPERGGMMFQSFMGPQEGRNPAMMWMGGGGDAGPASGRPVSEFMQTLPTTYVNWCGDVDLIGDIKPQGRFRNVMWDVSPIEILVHEPVPEGMKESLNQWGWQKEKAQWYFPGSEGRTVQVRVFAKADRVLLEVNSRLVAVEKVDEELTATFKDVVYVPGKIVAVSLDRDGNELTRKVLVTPGGAAAVRLTREMNNIDNDLVFVKMEVVDDDGNVVPDKFPLSISLDGAKFVSAGNAAPDDMASFRSQSPSTYNGAAMLVVRPEKVGFEVKVSSAGLREGVLTE